MWVGLLLSALAYTSAFSLLRPIKLHTHSSLSSQSDCILPEDLIPTGHLIELLQYCSITDRGQTATDGQRGRVTVLLDEIIASESEEPIDVAVLNGEWKLVYASESPYRSSPFFWAFRKLCEGMSSPVLAPEFAEAVFAITDGIPFKSVGQVKQTLSDTTTRGVGYLKSEVELAISLFDTVIPRGKSIMTTTAKTKMRQATSLGGSERYLVLDLTVVSTEVKESSIAKLPGMGIVNDLKFPTQEVFDALSSSGLLTGAGETNSGSFLDQLLRGASGHFGEMGSKEDSSAGGIEGRWVNEAESSKAMVAMKNAVFAGGSMRVAYAPDENFFVWSRIGPTPSSVSSFNTAGEPAAASDGAGDGPQEAKGDVEGETAELGDPFASFSDGMPDS